MPLSLEQEAELLVLAEEASDIWISIISTEDPEAHAEFNKRVKQMSSISPTLAELYEKMQDYVPLIRKKISYKSP